MLARGIEVFLLHRIFTREGLQIGYRFAKKWAAGGRAFRMRIADCGLKKPCRLHPRSFEVRVWRKIVLSVECSGSSKKAA
jgi:hypothetical protein